MSTSTLVLGQSNESTIREGFYAFLNKSQLTRAEQLDIMMEISLGDPFELVLERLVANFKLTAFQVKEIRAGRAEQLFLGPHVLIDEIGSGGFGKVYKAYHHLMNRIVALKVINPQFASDADIRELFLREVVANTRLQHRNLALAYNASDEGGTLYYVMEYVDGSDIETWITRHGPLPIMQVVELLIQAADAFDYLHQRGMVHRDIKPANLLLVGANLKTGEFPVEDPSQVRLKIIDFGLARLYPRGTPDSHTIRQEAELVGTPRFMAPEQATDFHNVDIRSDLYSLGCTFYRALTGRYPFDADSTMKIIRQHLQDDACPIQHARAEIPLPLARIIHTLMAKKPEDRYQTPSELSFALQDFLAQLLPIVPPSKPSVFRMPAHTLEAQVAPLAEPVLHTKPAVLQHLHRDWLQWIGIVELLSAGTAVTIPQTEYERLHSRLINALQHSPPMELSEQGTLALHQLIQPWVSLRSLTSLDRYSLHQLTQHGRRIAFPTPPTSPRWFGKFTAVAALVCLGLGITGYLLTSADVRQRLAAIPLPGLHGR